MMLIIIITYIIIIIIPPLSWHISIWRQNTCASPLLKRPARFSCIVATSFILLQHKLHAWYPCRRRRRGKPPSKPPPSRFPLCMHVKLFTWVQACGPGGDRWQPAFSLRHTLEKFTMGMWQISNNSYTWTGPCELHLNPCSDKARMISGPAQQTTFRQNIVLKKLTSNHLQIENIKKKQTTFQ